MEGTSPTSEGSEGGTQPPGRNPPTFPPTNARLRKVADLTKKLQTLADTSETVKRDGKEYVVVERGILQDIAQHLRAYDASPKETTVPNELERILENTEAIRKKLEEGSKAPTRTWSQVVAHTPTPTTDPAETRSATKRRDREITVTIGNERERTQIQNTSMESLLSAIQSIEPKKATEEILTIKKLPSEDLLITTTRTESRLILEKSSEWLHVIAPSARVKRTTFTVFAHSIRKSDINITQQLQTATKIQEQNQRAHPGLEILRVSWPKGSEKNGKKVGSLIIEVPTATAANRLITEGLVFGNEIKECERFVREARVTQCYNCQRFGHIARVCRNNTTCANCAGLHSTRNCSAPRETTRKCALCKESHGAWDKECKFQKAEQTRAQGLKESALRLYTDASRKVTMDHEEPHIRRRSIPELYVPKQRGRPTGLATAGKDPRQTQLNALGKRTASKMSPPPARERDASPTKKTKENNEVESTSRETPDYE